jgi:hypothetical protein
MASSDPGRNRMREHTTASWARKRRGCAGAYLTCDEPPPRGRPAASHWLFAAEATCEMVEPFLEAGDVGVGRRGAVAVGA